MRFNKKSTIIASIVFILFFITNVNFVNAANTTNTKNTTAATSTKNTTSVTSTSNTTTSTKSSTTTAKTTSASATSQSTEETHTVNSKDKSVSNYENTLKSLSVDGYDIYPDFNKNTTDYYVSIPDGITSLDVNAEPEYDTATVKITGNTKLATKGESIVKVVVTSKKKISKTYTIHVNRENNNGLNLSALSIDGVNLTPEFNEDTYYYSAEIAENEISPFTINAKANQEDATIEIVGNDSSLIKGDNLISVIVSNGEDTAVYQVEITIKDKSITTVVQNTPNSQLTVYLEKARNLILNNKRNLIIFLAIIFILIIILLIVIIKKIKNSKKDKKRQELKKRAI